MRYSGDETRLIVADSFKELSYNQKRLFMASVNPAVRNGAKYRDAVIKTLSVGVYNKLADDFYSDKYRGELFSLYESYGITCVTYKSAAYPEALKRIPAPPVVLYCRGNAELLKGELFGVVGSRRTPPQSLAAIKDICRGLAAHLTVVTGVADGADTAAAEGALGEGGAICVLPYGLDKAGQSPHKIVAEAEKAGLVISEFAGEQPALNYNFSLRNRIIAGLSRGVLVASAGENSGALSTARYAAEFGRDLFAIPYSLGISAGVGCNGLIKDGAHLVTGADDILTFYGFSPSEPADAELTDAERRAIEILRELGEIHLDKLAEALDIKNFEASAICSSLLIKGLAAKTGGNKYAPVK